MADVVELSTTHLGRCVAGYHRGRRRGLARRALCRTAGGGAQVRWRQRHFGPGPGVRDAVEYGPLPPQGRSFVGGGRDDPTVRDEACLTLTVWSPDTTRSLPVMVWIPGGAFVYGAGQLQLYNGSRLAANGDVVVVNVTYRIGVFGGFELGSLGEGFDDNLCLRDQIAALRWVQREHRRIRR